MTSKSRLPAPLPDPETGEVVPWTDRQIETAELLGHLPIVTDPAVWQLTILRRVVRAATIEEATQDYETVALKDVVGRTLTIHDAVLSPSAKRSGTGWYALMRVTFDPLPDGKADAYREQPEQIANTGATKALGVLEVVGRDGLFPWHAKVVGAQSNLDASREIVSLVPAERF